MNIYLFKNELGTSLESSSGQDSALPMQGEQVRSLVGELRSHIKKKKKNELKAGSPALHLQTTWQPRDEGVTEISPLVAAISWFRPRWLSPAWGCETAS